ncbi:hypothetical protein CAAN1_13S03950 [[Candida] anglica]|uniref:Zn(2)-C6 fungal-type domain-containing protein n=1 Tax=[Candida] anglica TaxID=148631 RepID=A0ABP0EGC1_9ASCO
MEYYYRKSMGNGAETSKFRLNVPPPIQSNQSNLRSAAENDTDRKATSQQTIQPLTSRSSSIRSPDSVKSSISDAASTDGTSISSPVSATNDATTTTNNNNNNGTATVVSKSNPVESPETHHTNNCNRCYRLKKKCSREYPKCANCTKTRRECVYVSRSNKRRKRVKVGENETVLGDLNKPLAKTKDLTPPSDQAEPEFIHIVAGTSGDSKTSENEEKKAVANSLVSISSLLSNEHTNTIEGGDRFREKRQFPTLLPPPRRDFFNTNNNNNNNNTSVAYGNGGGFSSYRPNPATSFIDKLVVKSLHSSSNKEDNSSGQEEFLTMRAIADEDIPVRLALNYFHNYETICPFIDQEQFMKTIKLIDFTKETIVNLDVYLLLSVGSLIHDKNTNSNLFKTYFSEKIVESIIDIVEFNNIDSLKLLLLLTIYSLHSYKEDLCWELLGVLTRHVIRQGLYKPSNKPDQEQSGTSSHFDLKERVFWSVYNLDKTLSLLIDRPSQMPQEAFITLKLPIIKANCESEHTIEIFNQEIRYSKLLDRLLTLKLSEEKSNLVTQVKDLSSNIEKWRVCISRVIHSSQYVSPEDYISLINLKYYYFLIELDQLSSSESFQFTLQFLSNSFSLLISDNDVSSNTDKPSKSGIEFSLCTSFWYSQLFKVVQCSLESLSSVVESEVDLQKIETSLKLSEFNSNLQLMVNLFKYLMKQNRQFGGHNTQLEGIICVYTAQLSTLGMNMMGYMMAGSDRTGLASELKKIKSHLRETEL